MEAIKFLFAVINWTAAPPCLRYNMYDKVLTIFYGGARGRILVR